MRTLQVKRPRAWLGVLFLAALGLWALGSSVWSDPPPLAADMQLKVDKAIDNGVNFLKGSMGPGTWARDNNHVVGLAAMPGLTLLECGLPANDPAVKLAADFVRWRLRTTKVDATYEIALSLLFLDRLGNTKDRPLIKTLALRLVAGQTPTGGWSYKCPVLSPTQDRQLYTVLENLNTPVLYDPLTGSKNATSTDNGSYGTFTPELKDSKSSASQYSPNSQDKMADPSARLGTFSSAGSRNWAWCIKNDESSAEIKATKPKSRVVIPRELANLPVLFPPANLPVIEPKDKGDQPMFGTTDNSNTQFAILALWAARRHQIPTLRTLNLIAKRFYTSQNADGSWGYHYQFGGGEPERPPMTCVGLLGLAVAHGLANEIDAKVLPQRDPWVIKGLLALTKNVGVPTGKTENLPMANLYFLWSVERVGVLYDLPTIGNKEWYRWGAEILVANQTPNGNWDKGGYPGANPTVDTCLALLFLKRSNLAKDLAAKLPFQPGQLAQDVIDQLPPDPKAKDKIVTEIKPEPKENKQPAVVEAKPPESAAAGTLNDSIRNSSSSATRSQTPVTNLVEGTSHAGLWLLGFLAILVIGGGITLAVYARGQDDDEEEEDESSSRSRRRKKKARS